MAININQLADEINKQLREYADGVGEEMEKVAQKVAKDGVKTLKLRSPKDTGKYAAGWKATKVDGKWTVHNRIYQLTHLLEKGHAKVGGGRVAARVHIKPVEEQMIDDYVQGVEEAIKR
ncbi:HK97 gp10 family phage protein [Solibacillus isronensis]|uniref:HK97 gp10 family phage protein n=1 Tax=Solibacillus isronensis TaxID=412383 RepID=UPI00399FF47F